MSEKHPTENATALIVGGEVKTIGLAVSGKLFVFSPAQMDFLLSLQKLKSVDAAAIHVGKDTEWAKRFLASRKFRQYINSKMEEFSVRNGLTVEWWYQFGKWVADGQKEYYKVRCTDCPLEVTMNTYEVESFRQDDMTLEVPCPACYKPTTTTHEVEPFKPSREQVVAWQDLGARLIPKIERVHHEFTGETFSFSYDGENHAAD